MKLPVSQVSNYFGDPENEGLCEEKRKERMSGIYKQLIHFLGGKNPLH